MAVKQRDASEAKKSKGGYKCNSYARQAGDAFFCFAGGFLSPLAAYLGYA
jgi:hypothetical protein